MACEAFFSHSSNLEEVAKKHMKQAQYRIWICAYSISLKSYQDVFDWALSNSIELKIIADAFITKYNPAPLIQKYNVQIISMANTQLLMHNKFCIIDDIVLTGSFNFSQKGKFNFENFVVINENYFALKYEKEFKYISEMDTCFLEKQKKSFDVNQDKLTLVIKKSDAYLMPYAELEDWFFNNVVPTNMVTVEKPSDYYEFHDSEEDNNEYSRIEIKQKAIDELEAIMLYNWISLDNDGYYGYLRLYCNEFSSFKIPERIIK